MAISTKIFIGSSHDALELARAVKEAIDNEYTEAIIWDSEGTFPLGLTLLETIESLPFGYQGAVLLWTEDHGRDAVTNVLFEYGTLAARLTRARVAICQFGKVQIPSDLQGLKRVEINENWEDGTLPPEAVRELQSWAQQLPRIAEGVPPIVQVHGYSGIWRVQSRFSLWKGDELQKGDKVYFDGKTFLMLQTNGEGGSGIQVGKLYILVQGYQAAYEIVNEIPAASVDEKGTLHMRVKVIRREGPKNESGRLPHPKFREGLTSTEFDLDLHVVQGKSRTLKGTHKYATATTVFQRAKEHWVHQSLFCAPSL